MYRIIFILSVLLCPSLFGADLSIFGVGQANFTILKSGDSVLVYDCGYTSGNWKDHEQFTTAKRGLLQNILKSVKRFGIVVSHNDTDHKNLVTALLKLFRNLKAENGFADGDNPSAIINITTNSLSDADRFCLFKLQNFMTPQGITLYPLIPNFCSKSVSTNDRSLILKVTWNYGQYAFLMTGDATKETLSAIQSGNIQLYGDSDNQQLLRTEAMNLFGNIVGFMPAHHGSDTEGSLAWSQAILGQSQFPVLTVISSDPNKSNHIPSLETVQLLSLWSFNNLTKCRSGSWCCIPHVIDCYYQAVTITDKILAASSVPMVIKYPSVCNNHVLPIFVTSNLRSGLYRISLNGDVVQLKDNEWLLYECNLPASKGTYYGLLPDICSFFMYKFIDEQRTEARNQLIKYLVMATNNDYAKDFVSGLVDTLPSGCVAQMVHGVSGVGYWQKVSEILEFLQSPAPPVFLTVEQVGGWCESSSGVALNIIGYMYFGSGVNPTEILYRWLHSSPPLLSAGSLMDLEK